MSAVLALDARGIDVVLNDGAAVVCGVDLSVGKGQVLGLVGESGSGKTTLGFALLGFAKPGATIRGGVVSVGDVAVLGPGADSAAARGRLIAYVPQDPSTALNPSLRVRDQLALPLRAHRRDLDVASRTRELMEQVRLPTTEEWMQRYPHQLSGGQQQRLAIAMALSCKPDVVVLDEPTTGLDVITQSLIVDEIDRLRRELGTSFVYVSHDLAVVASISDEIAVMYAGRIVEQGPTEQLLTRPRHPYTTGLLAAVPDHRFPTRPVGVPGVSADIRHRSPGCAFEPRCALAQPDCRLGVPPLVEHTSGHLAACLHTELMPTAAASAPIRTFPRLETPTLLEVETLRLTHGLGHRLTVAVHDASFVVRQREIVALVGESGSGKTTTARAVVGLHRPAAGRIRFNGEDLSIAKSRTREQRRRVQIVFQNPYSSLQPTREVGAAVIDAARFLRKLDRPAARVEAEAMWDLVRLPRRLFRAMPAQLSGGERQRVAIARALVASPELVVCDEITSALDASVQASVLQLLLGLRDELGLSLLFITHDLGVVASLADWVVVLDSGRICEAGPVDAVLNDPQMPYTQQLIAAAPSLNAHDRSTPGTSLGGPSLTNRRSQA